MKNILKNNHYHIFKPLVYYILKKGGGIDNRMFWPLCGDEVGLQERQANKSYIILFN